MAANPARPVNNLLCARVAGPSRASAGRVRSTARTAANPAARCVPPACPDTHSDVVCAFVAGERGMSRVRQWRGLAEVPVQLDRPGCNAIMGQWRGPGDEDDDGDPRTVFGD